MERLHTICFAVDVFICPWLLSYVSGVFSHRDGDMSDSLSVNAFIHSCNQVDQHVRASKQTLEEQVASFKAAGSVRYLHVYVGTSLQTLCICMCVRWYFFANLSSVSRHTDTRSRGRISWSPQCSTASPQHHSPSCTFVLKNAIVCIAQLPNTDSISSPQCAPT